MQISDYSYELPEERIAQQPPSERGASRLLVLHRADGRLEHRRYADLADYVEPGDVVVLNDTKVIKARLLATNADGKTRELLLLEDHHTMDPYRRRALYRGKLHEGEKLTVASNVVTVTSILQGGVAEIAADVPLLEIAEHTGTVPLPPYMKRKATAEDVKRYQTVFAHKSGSVAAPTASLNFTHELERRLTQKGAQLVYLTLHVGMGTFLPIRTDNVEEHDMHSEYFEIQASTIAAIQQAKQAGRKIFAVGTTVTRTLEYAHQAVLHQSPADLSGEANIFIYPGYEFKVVDALLTNFHAPKSTVLMLAAAFAGWENLQAAYQTAIKKEYAFLSYGDSMLII